MLHAVVIGIDSFTDSRIPSLRSASADAEALSIRLEEAITTRQRIIQTLLNKEATRSNIVKVIGEALPRRQTEEDLVLIYFAGHGSPEQKSPPDRVSRYLIPHDTDYEQVFATGIGLETDIVTILERQFGKQVLLIIDACFSGKAGGRTFIGPNLGRRMSQFRTPISLRELDLGYGKVILTACGDNELALENSDHGVFTNNLLKVLSARGKPTIGIGELYDAVFAGVVRDTKRLQHPVLKGHIEGMRFPRLNTKRR